MKTFLKFILLFFLSFALSRAFIWITPGDPVEILISEMGYKESPEALSQALGLQSGYFESLYYRFIDLLHGNFGLTLLTQEPILPILFSATIKTTLLTVLSMGFAFLWVLTAFLLLAFTPKIRPLFEWFIAVEWSLPTLLVGPILLLLFSVIFPIFEPAGSPILPALALSISIAAYWIRISMTLLSSPQSKEYIRSAQARGCGEFHALLKYGLAPHMGALTPQIMSQWGALMTGAFIVEAIFEYPGLGSVYLKAILQRDYLVFESVLFWNITLVLLFHWMGELWSTYVDPRLRS